MIIGQGVRFNAEKKKIGNYYSTPIYSFRMKHTVCGGWIEIRTDPKNTAYEVAEGAKKRDTGEDKEVEGEIKIRTAEERERLEKDAFAKLEGKVEDKRRHMSEQSRLEELQKAQEKDWADPYEVSRRLRRTFRADRKVRKDNLVATEALKDRMGLGMDILDETEEDRLRAGLVDFVPSTNAASGRGLFDKPAPGIKTEPKERGKRGKKPDVLETTKARLREELSSNTRALMDPFMNDSAAWEVGAKRRRTESEEQPTQLVKALVDYDSD
jgi:coiled-coil domain-containing protein 130